jgi:hypothetical protein
MLKSMALKNWMDALEAMEERLEGMKLTAWPSLGEYPGRSGSIVRSTAGLLKGRIPTGVTYQRQIRRLWNVSIRRRAA